MEEWRTVIDENGEIWDKYEVSSLGRVRNSRKLMKLRVDDDNYLQVKLTKDKRGKQFRVHRLVAFAFPDKIPNDNPTEKTQVDHIDRNRQNNCVENLRWATPRQNIANSDSGRNGKRVLCVETGKIYESVSEACRSLGYKSHSCIVECCSGKLKKAYGYTWIYVEE